MGCAGMARHRRPLERALGIPVIDPTQAAVTMALGAVCVAELAPSRIARSLLKSRVMAVGSRPSGW